MYLKVIIIDWLLNLIIHHDMREIDLRFYELLPEESLYNNHSRDSIKHPYDVDWNIYDSLRPTGQTDVNEGAQHD